MLSFGFDIIVIIPAHRSKESKF